MSLDDRFEKVLYLTGPKLPGEIQEEFTAMLSPTNLAIMVGVLVAWAGSHYFGVGFVVDLILLIGGLILLGWQVWQAAEDFVNFIRITAEARTHTDLDRASSHLADFIAVVGVAAFMVLVMKGGKKVKSRFAVSLSAAARKAGMTVKHARIFQTVANTSKQIVAVRFTNSKSAQWIAKKFPAKPQTIKAKTSQQTGLVTVRGAAETVQAKNAGYFVLDQNGIARGRGGAIDLSADQDWPKQLGQIIDPKTKKPLTGDYDLMAVIDPNAKGRNIALAAEGGERVTDMTNPIIKVIRQRLNSMMGEERVMHGAHDSFGSLQSAVGKSGDGVIVFEPGNKTPRLLNSLEEVQDFYQSIGRQPITGKY